MSEEELRRLIAVCCAESAAADKVALASARESARVAKRVRELRREILQRLRALEDQVGALQRAKAISPIADE